MVNLVYNYMLIDGIQSHISIERTCFTQAPDPNRIQNKFSCEAKYDPDIKLTVKTCILQCVYENCNGQNMTDPNIF